ncbi:MAG TPA: hypothetical protein VF982_00950 [Anaerolineales bacterium]
MTKRTRMTKGEVEQLEYQVYDILAEDHPQSIRHVFYRLTDPRLPISVEKSEAGYRQVQIRLTKMRRADEIPYGWISDSTRRGYRTYTYDGAADFIRRVAGLYRHSLWENQPSTVEVWVESRSLAGVLEDDCEDLAVNLYPCGGFASITLAHEAAEEINARDKPAVIIYVGDYDPAGVLIDVSLEQELRQHLDVPLEFTRLAITEQQIKDHDLPTKPRKAKDRRSQHVLHTVEAEAMPAADMRRMVRQAVEAYLPAQALNIAKLAEAEERRTLLKMAAAAE